MKKLKMRSRPKMRNFIRFLYLICNLMIFFRRLLKDFLHKRNERDKTEKNDKKKILFRIGKGKGNITI